MKPEKYLGKTIEFIKLHRFMTHYGYGGSEKVEAYEDNVFIASGSTKAEALKEAKKVLKKIYMNEKPKHGVYELSGEDRKYGKYGIYVNNKLSEIYDDMEKASNRWVRMKIDKSHIMRGGLM